MGIEKEKYALIGKNIQHSRSPEMYEKLLGHKVDYTFLDYENERDVERLDVLLRKFGRISITAPYKNHVFKNCNQVSDHAKELEAVNAIKLKDGLVMGTNTDALAFEEIYNEDYLGYYPIILGDGAMSRLAQNFFKIGGINYLVLSRKKRNLDKINQYLKESSEKNIVLINACGRSYKFNYQSSKSLKVWDLNYSMPEQKDYVLAQGHDYTDGQELLIRQAQYALSFWNS